MYVHYEVNLGFKLPEEGEAADIFERENKGFTKSLTTGYCVFSKTSYLLSVNPPKGGDAE